MTEETIDYDALKGRGFLREKENGLFTLRTRMPAGNFRGEHLDAVRVIAEKYGRGLTHLTTRQGIEIPFIKLEDIDEVERTVKKAGLETGTSGPRLRTTTCCPGNNWCKSGLVNTFHMYDRIEKELGIKCGLTLPHKFKIVISGCANACTRAESSEIGMHGAVDTQDPKKRIGYKVYVGGCGGRTPHHGIKLKKVFSEDEVLALIKRVVMFFKENAKPRQRLALLIKDMGKESFLAAIGESEE
jgi:dissimilatory sulfite reductase (desulfoviridin) alpha/beta subunit